MNGRGVLHIAGDAAAKFDAKVRVRAKPLV
jgi:hypothetical protein